MPPAKELRPVVAVKDATELAFTSMTNASCPAILKWIVSAAQTTTSSLGTPLTYVSCLVSLGLEGTWGTVYFWGVPLAINLPTRRKTKWLLKNF
jgi:hypothetical protein